MFAAKTCWKGEPFTSKDDSIRILVSVHVGGGDDLVETEDFCVPFDCGVEVVYGDGYVIKSAFDCAGRHGCRGGGCERPGRGGLHQIEWEMPLFRTGRGV